MSSSIPTKHIQSVWISYS